MGARPRSRSLKSISRGGRARRAPGGLREANAILPRPLPPRWVRRRRRAQSPRATRSVVRAGAGPRWKAPPSPEIRPPALRRSRSRCPRPAIGTSATGVELHSRRGTNRASFFAARPAPCRGRRGQGRCGGSPAARRQCRISPTRSSWAMCGPKDASARDGSGTSASMEYAGRASGDTHRPLCRWAHRQKRSRARRLHANSEPAELTVSNEQVTARRRLSRLDATFRQLGHGSIFNYFAEARRKHWEAAAIAILPG